MRWLIWIYTVYFYTFYFYFRSQFWAFSGFVHPLLNGLSNNLKWKSLPQKFRGERVKYLFIWQVFSNTSFASGFDNATLKELEGILKDARTFTSRYSNENLFIYMTHTYYKNIRTRNQLYIFTLVQKVKHRVYKIHVF